MVTIQLVPPAARWGHLETLWRMREGRCDAFALGAFAQKVTQYN